jgi:ribosomal protein S18 acetylase RimI-like enzyme
MIHYTRNLKSISSEMLQVFFAGWPNPPSPATHLELLRKSDESFLAIDDESGQVVGFITAITDQVLTAHIPLLEVLPGFRGLGIGMALLMQMMDRLKHLYAIDLLCDPEMVFFYQKAGLQPATGMMVRHYENQSGS